VINNQVEKKYLDTWSDGTIDYSGVFQDLTVIPQGTTISSRVGAKATTSRIKMNWEFTVADTFNFCRVVIFTWHMDNSVDVPQASEIFSHNSVAYRQNSQFLPVKPSNFKVHYDKRFALDTYNPTKAFTIDIDVKQEMSFLIGANTGKDHIYCFYVSDSGAATHPGYYYDAQVFFTDN